MHAWQVEGMQKEFGLDELLPDYLPGSRAWLLKLVDAWRDTPAGPDMANRMFLLLAGPGMGKSMFSAMLTQERKDAITVSHQD